MKRTRLLGLALSGVLLILLVSCSSNDSTSPDGDETTECPSGQVLGPDGKCHTLPDGDVPDPSDGDQDTDIEPEDDDTDVDTVDIDGDKTDTDGDTVDTDGDTVDTDGDEIENVDTDGDVIDIDIDSYEGSDNNPDGDVDEEDADEIMGTCQGPCTQDEQCGYGCYCQTDTCGRECFSDFDCGGPRPWCNPERGRCEVMPADEEDVEEIIVNCPGGTDEECSVGYICTSNFCNLGCTPGGCPFGFTCDDSDHPRCQMDSSKAGQALKNLTPCQSDNMCKSGQICDWNRSVCISGCRDDAECPPEAPVCSEGICY